MTRFFKLHSTYTVAKSIGYKSNHIQTVKPCIKSIVDHRFFKQGEPSFRVEWAKECKGHSWLPLEQLLLKDKLMKDYLMKLKSRARKRYENLIIYHKIIERMNINLQS